MLFEFEASGSYIGQPESVSETAPTASFGFARYPPGHPQIQATVVGVTDTWTIQLDPPDGEQLAVGAYPHASGDGPEDAELLINRFGSGCPSGDQSGFEIHELTRDTNGAPTSIALSFRFECDGELTFGLMAGRLRINSTKEIPSLAVPHTDREFGGVATGTSLTRHFTLAANGDLPVTVTDVSIDGPGVGAFVLDDDCASVTLDPGETCGFDITFAPTVLGSRLAALTIEHDGPVSPIRLPFGGTGLIPTSSTLAVIADPENPDNLLWKAFVTPVDANGPATMVLDGEEIGVSVGWAGVARLSKPRVVGAHTLQLRYPGNGPYAPHASPQQTFQITDTWPPILPPDTAPPVVTPPTHRLVNGSTISGGRTAVRLTWTGTDQTGVSNYQVDQSTDGMPWTSAAVSLLPASLDVRLAPNHTYRFRVMAHDELSHLSEWVYGPTFRLTHVGESNASVKYTGTWSTSTSSVYWGGKAKASSQAGAKASLTFTGRSVEVVSRKGPARGKAQIYVNGVLKATVDLYASTYQNQRVVWTGSWSSSASRTITVKVLGTSGRPRVDLDAFVVGS